MMTLEDVGRVYAYACCSEAEILPGPHSETAETLNILGYGLLFFNTSTAFSVITSDVFLFLIVMSTKPIGSR